MHCVCLMLGITVIQCCEWTDYSVYRPLSVFVQFSVFRSCYMQVQVHSLVMIIEAAFPDWILSLSAYQWCCYRELEAPMSARENYPLFSFFLDHQLTKGRLTTYISWTCRLMTVCWSRVANRQHLRSVDTRKLVFWRTRTVLGARDFAVFCAVVWNSLSTDLRVFYH